MRDGKRKHMDKDSRVAIEEGLYNGDSCRAIARAAGVSPSTVTREVRGNRTVRERPRRDGAKLAVRCVRYRSCERVGRACEGCGTSYVRCRDCRTRSCIDSCPDFELRMCPVTEAWPYVCPRPCPKSSHCTFPRVRYRAEEAQSSYEGRLASSRSGVDLTGEQLAAINGVVAPLVRQGHSFEAICAAHPELGVCVRTLYNYQAAGILETSDVELPRKARVRPRRRRKERGRPRVDRSGREYADFAALPADVRARAVQGDSVEGRQGGRHDILSLHLVARKFQLYLRKRHADAAATVRAIDCVERAMGSRERFEAAFGVMLLDRGVEFDDFDGIELSCLEPGRRRCRVFYCDPQDSNQKSRCERNHEQLRRILPKGRTDVDLLSDADVAVCCGHVNSYPLASLGGISPIDNLGALVPPAALLRLGVPRLASADVVLRPSLMPHAVKQ